MSGGKIVLILWNFCARDTKRYGLVIRIMMMTNKNAGFTTANCSNTENDSC